MLRLFVAVDLPVPLQQEVASLCKDVTNARWCKAEQLHITLRFMGRTPEASLPEIRRRLAGIAGTQFPLCLAGVGVFPEQARYGEARVLWLGLEGALPLAALKDDIDERLAHVAPPDEQKRFSPHLTLARFPRHPDETLAQFLARHGSYRSNSWTVAHVHLYKSTLSPHGARHERIDSYKLAGKSPEN